MAVEKLPLDRACEEVFGTSYHGLASEIAQFWGMHGVCCACIRGEMGMMTLWGRCSSIPASSRT